MWDADALNMLAAGLVSLPKGSVITPHPGEAARLLGVGIKDVQADRAAAVRALARKFDTVCVLKGSGSLIADASGQLALCDRGHPAMATAGLGDAGRIDRRADGAASQAVRRGLSGRVAARKRRSESR